MRLQEVREMRCRNCREVIDEPVWVDGEPYCSQECADSMIVEDEEYELEYEQEYEEEV
jgi:hypothetical protein